MRPVRNPMQTRPNQKMATTGSWEPEVLFGEEINKIGILDYVKFCKGINSGEYCHVFGSILNV